ncbi:hypothetical protein GCM10007049_02280 [Echinicola pacifica]|uniref:LTXXQ motif family protein n=1 Tax=Echinicola pacifica TaxID=346377 RepID=A0A918UI90_9BACT|nr:hypothetical protein [Echinicola pacifica]GGZ13979.1 hypothetical protein GCM10007049_02280 [Echinicola pacifica]
MKKILLFLVMIACSGALYAQRPAAADYDSEKLQAAKIAFLTQKLDLQPDQATEFWPLYNKFDEERRGYFKQMRGKEKVEVETLTNEEAKKLIENKFKMQQGLLDLEKDFTWKIAKILSAKQAYMLQEADRDFVRHLYKMNRQHGPGPR